MTEATGGGARTMAKAARKRKARKRKKANHGKRPNS
ncbi:50S ribosomal protein bL37 [Salininema proteolyticum]|uniref:50S ribosomal protein bL37 n=1 Tax=Salininema proteolyticum TaxID=1607685 RepID=A0ABV8U1S1_9ACTN